MVWPGDLIHTTTRKKYHISANSFLGHPTNEETENNQIGEVYSTTEEISPNNVYEEVKDETDNLDHEKEGN